MAATDCGLSYASSRHVPVPSSSRRDSSIALWHLRGHSYTRGSGDDAILTSQNRSSVRGQGPPSDRHRHRKSSPSKPHGQRSTSGRARDRRSIKVKKIVLGSELGLPEVVRMTFSHPFTEGIILPR
jgi:hypothetical protein